MSCRVTSNWFVFVCFSLTANSGLAQQVSTHPEDERLYSVTRFGAIADGKTRNTAAIQKAIDTASAAGGGTVYVPAGQYLSGTLVLRSNVTLHLENGAVILGSTELGDYPQHKPAYRSFSDSYVNRALIYAEKAHDIGITGAGTLNGQGGHPGFSCQRPGYGFLERPYLIRMVECENVHVAGVTLRDSAMWVQHYLACDNLTVERVTVLSNVNCNNDMIDIDGCRDVRMFGCTGESGDDAITLKSTGPRACERITISDCTVASHCSGIKLGTESTGGFRDITITNCVVSRPPGGGWAKSNKSEGIGLETVDGGTLERVILSNIVIEGTHAPIFMRRGNRARKHVPDAPTPAVGIFRDVTISNIIARDAGDIGCPIVGIEGHPIENVTLRDLRFTFDGGGTLDTAMRQIPELADAYPSSHMFGRLPAYGFFVRHVKGLTMENIQIGWEKPDQRPAVICEDVRDLKINGLHAAAAKDGAETIRLKDVDTVLIRGCIAAEDSTGFLSAAGKLGPITLLGNDLSRAGYGFSIPDDIRQRVLFEAANRMPGK